MTNTTKDIFWKWSKKDLDKQADKYMAAKSAYEAAKKEVAKLQQEHAQVLKDLREALRGKEALRKRERELQTKLVKAARLAVKRAEELKKASANLKTWLSDFKDFWGGINAPVRQYGA